jgi:iron complex outermembrane receptor protein
VIKGDIYGACLLGLALWPAAARAQRTEENAVTQSSDGFGFSVGNDKTGIYTVDEVRGFNPVDAGNVRIEGLYFDQVERPPSRLVEGNAVRVGISAQHFAFPAPTGLIDYSLTKPKGDAQLSITSERGPYGGEAGSIEFKLPLQGTTLGISGGVGARDQIRPEGGRNQFRNAGLTLAWRPYASAEIVVMAGGFNETGTEARPTLFPAGTALPPRQARGVFLGQRWADKLSKSRLFGGLARLPLGGVRVEAGLFLATKSVPHIYADLLTGVDAQGRSSGRFIVADADNRDEFWSGEVRVVREIGGPALHHKISASLRGRQRNRLLGGTQTLALGPSSALLPDERAMPALALPANDRDTVRQWTGGIAYTLDWRRHGSLDLGLSKSRYRKTVDFARPSLPTARTADNPLLWNVSATVIASKQLAFYGGLVRGQEEALTAPDIATNRSEAPAAIRTTQSDIGLRFAATPHLTIVAGAFSIKKPYFNLDPARRYRQLGQIRNRGLEVSVAGQIVPGLSLIGGVVLLDPVISGEAVDKGQIGTRPVGQVRRRTSANLDWRSRGGKGPLSIDIGLDTVSSRYGNALNTLSAPPRETVNLGARYRFALAGHKLLVRPHITNIFNDYGWLVSSSGGFTYAPGRTATVQLIADF